MSSNFLDVEKKYEIKWSLITFFSGIFLAIFMFLLFKQLSIKLATVIIFTIFVIYFPVLTGKVRDFLFVVLFFTLPLNIDKAFMQVNHVGGASGLMVSLYDISILLLYILWISEIIRKKNITFNFPLSVIIPILGFISMAFLSVIKSPFRNLSLFEITGLIKMNLGFFYLANNIKSDKDIKLILYSLLIGLLIEGFLGLAQFKTGRSYLPAGLGYRRSMINFKGKYRVTGTWISYNDFAWYLTYIIPVPLSLLFARTETKYKLLYGFILALGIGALLSTLSRAGYISLVMSTLLVFLLAFRKIKGKTNLYNFVGSIILFIGIFIAFSVMNPRSLKTAKNRMFVDDDNGSAESRIPQIKIAYSIIKSNPFLGVGINNYTEVVGQYDTQKILATITDNQVHNIFLSMGSEIGIPGLVFFLWIVFAMFREGMEYITSNDNLTVYIVIGIIAGIIAFLVHGLVDCQPISGKLFLFFWLFMGFIFGINYLDKNRRSIKKTQLALIVNK